MENEYERLAQEFANQHKTESDSKPANEVAVDVNGVSDEAKGHAMAEIVADPP